MQVRDEMIFRSIAIVGLAVGPCGSGLDGSGAGGSDAVEAIANLTRVVIAVLVAKWSTIDEVDQSVFDFLPSTGG